MTDAQDSHKAITGPIMRAKAIGIVVFATAQPQTLDRRGACRWNAWTLLQQVATESGLSLGKQLLRELYPSLIADARRLAGS